MNKEIKEKWLKALRSGEYKQGRGYLRKESGDEDRYCCLGVLAKECLGGEWVKKDSLGINFRQLSDSVWVYRDNFSGECRWGSFPKSVTDHLEIKDPEWIDYLTDMNDNRYMDFDQIADWIERNL